MMIRNVSPEKRREGQTVFIFINFKTVCKLKVRTWSASLVLYVL